MRKLIVLMFAISIVGCTKTSTKTVDDQTKSTPTNIQFTDATKSSGVNFTHDPSRTKDKHLPEVMGAGVAVADFNNDGWVDILLVNSGAMGTETRPAEAKNYLYLNDKTGKFNDETAAWNLSGVGYGQGVAIGDFDNDGFTDVFLTNYEGDNRLLRNTGEKFEDVTEAAGIIKDGKWATSAGFFDYDNDGDLDIYVVRYIKYDMAKQKKVYRNRMQIYTNPSFYDPEPDQLWQNEGNGKFTDVSSKIELEKDTSGLALGLGDIDRDGDEDIYVANDLDPNLLWINESGSFKEIAQVSGSAYSEVGKEQGSMGVDFSDVDNNNLLDIVVTNFQQEPTALYSQTDKLLFNETSDAIGIGEAARQRLSFGIEFFDADNDGDEELLVANGHIEDNIEKNSDSITFPQQNTLYENMGDGKFVDISNSSGEALLDNQVSRGLAVADFDNDGDLDFIITNNGGTAQIGLNDTKDIGNFVGLTLEGDGKTNRNAIGTRLVAKIGDKTIERQIMGSQSYLSVSDFRILFGLGKAEKIDELEIYWLGGEKQILKDVTAGKYYYLKQGSDLSEKKE